LLLKFSTHNLASFCSAQLQETEEVEEVESEEEVKSTKKSKSKKLTKKQKEANAKKQQKEQKRQPQSKKVTTTTVDGLKSSKATLTTLLHGLLTRCNRKPLISSSRSSQTTNPFRTFLRTLTSDLLLLSPLPLYPASLLLLTKLATSVTNQLVTFANLTRNDKAR